MGRRSRRPTAGIGFRVALTVGLLVLAGCGGGADPVVVGSFTFDESVVLAEVYAQVLEDAGVAVERRFDLGTRATVAALLEAGEVSVVPEYLGSLTHHLGGQPSADTDETIRLVSPLAATAGLTLLDPAPGEATNGIAVDQVTATDLGLASISDLAPHAGNLVLGGPLDCPARETCLLGLENVYGLVFEAFHPLDSAGPLTRAALADGTVDVAIVFTTSGWLTADGLVVLDDDRGLQPIESVVPVFNTETLAAHGGRQGAAAAALDHVSERLTTAVLVDLNRQVELEGVEPADAVAGWLESLDGT